MPSWQRRIKPIASGGLTGTSLGADFALLRPRSDLIRLQYAKLVNYFPDLIAPEWGGNFLPTGDYQYILTGYERFCQDINASDNSKPMWIRRLDELAAWGPDNVALSAEPDPSLGQPYEAYLAINGSIMRLQYAQKVLLVDMEFLFDLKLKLMVDSAVIAAAIIGNLEERHLQHRLKA